MTATAIRGAPPSFRSRALGPLAIVFLAFGLSTALWFPFLSLFLTTAAHAGPLKLSVFLLVQPLSGVVVSTVLGRLSDGRVARRRILIVAAAAGCSSAAVFSVLRSYWPLLVVGCTLSAMGGALMPQGFAYARAMLANEPTAPMITSTLRMFFSIAWVAGPPLGSLLLNAGGFRTVYLCASALYAVVALVVARWLIEPPASVLSRDDIDIGTSDAGSPSAATSDVGTATIGPATAIAGARRALWATLAALVLLQGAMSLNVQLVPLLVRHNLHAGVGASGVILGICAAIEIPAMLGFGLLTKRVRLQPLVLSGPLFGIAYYALASASVAVWQLAAVQLLNACYIAVIGGLAISYVQELLPLQPGRASTLYSNTFVYGMILAGPVLGVGAKFSYRISFIVASGLAAGGLVLLSIGRPSRINGSARVTEFG